MILVIVHDAEEFNVEKDFDVKNKYQRAQKYIRCDLCQMAVGNTFDSVGPSFTEDDVYDHIEKICDIDDLYTKRELIEEEKGWKMVEVTEDKRSEHTVRWQSHAMKELCDNIVRPYDDEIKDILLKHLKKGARKGDDAHVRKEVVSTRSFEAGNDLPVFAFFKPRPMITDLTKGPMGEVARRMCPEAPPKPVGQLDRCTTGLMIFTLDGCLTCHLNSHAPKTYRAWYDGWRRVVASSQTWNANACWRHAFSRCRTLAGRWLCRLRIHRKAGWCSTTQREEIEKFQYSADVRIKCGKFHVVKRLFMSVGKSVLRLQRLAIGELSLEACGLQEPGDFVELTAEQVEALWQDNVISAIFFVWVGDRTVKSSVKKHLAAVADLCVPRAWRIRWLSLLDFTQDVDILGPSTGLTLLYVHGGGGCRKMFRQHAAAMVKNGFRCVLMDLPGHGSRMDEVLTMESAINAIVKVIKQHAPLYKGVKPVYVGGSLGGYIGMEFLGRHPDLCSCAIITMCGQNVGLGRGWAAGAGLWVMGTLLPKMGTRQIMSALVAQVRKNGHIPESLFMDDHLRTGMFFGQALAQVEILKETNPQAALGKFPGAMLFINGSQECKKSDLTFRTYVPGS
eukprot:g22843.t2